jgi:phosphoribosyl 1,2-cyclic phosphodiesterase
MKITLWGVRGSIACPGPDTVKYGGNTSCIELRIGDTDRLIVIDAGSGIRALSNHLIQNDLKNGPINSDIFITHTHWDHIMGFPFFKPIFIPGTELNIYGPVTYEEDTLEKIIGDQLSYRYFPVLHSELAANINYHPIKECKMDLGDGIHLTTKYLNHPLLCLGLRFEYKGKTLCTAYDTEPFHNVFADETNAFDQDPLVTKQAEKVAKDENKKLRQFYQDADILLHDAQYTQAEYDKNKQGWGHSYYEYAVENALEANVKKLIFYHHDPDRTDTELNQIESHFQDKYKSNTNFEVYAAREGVSFTL